MKKIISFVLGLCMTFSLGAGLVGCGDKKTERAFKNVILVIGDGMGENHILNTITYFGLETPAFMEDQVGYIGTDSLTGTTDSAAGGTALATGTKVNNSEIGQLNGVNLEQITTIAQNANMKTGVVTTDTLDGATPAAFSAHSPSRNSTNLIISTQKTSNIDLLLGRYSSDYTNRSYDFEDAGYTMVKDTEALEAAKDADKLVGVLPNINSEYIVGSELHYQLKDMTKFAVEYLENEDGFFLMIEGAYIDKHSHSNNLYSMMCETRSLIDTIEYLYEYAADGETAVFITADHETGSLMKANSVEEMDNFLYGSTSHSSTPVPVYVKNYVWKPENFGYRGGINPENTMVFQACKEIITGGK